MAPEVKRRLKVKSHEPESSQVDAILDGDLSEAAEASAN